ncbi:hypothetical protein SeMB42_g04553 [Synchytrium endobioticum]|uniref:Uncharacterized protein n=1 Tax=Synchytrium endobioticum TaxID=286115 RepID=A0A507CLW6_9FUNG|nr:hypothetical protein SeLEV6574_g07036 [Synchytrium endobioticum]TPX43853.1 hypothetical protein SeMB42_g04553 [Synchytrium endobioticum]
MLASNSRIGTPISNLSTTASEWELSNREQEVPAPSTVRSIKSLFETPSPSSSSGLGPHEEYDEDSRNRLMPSQQRAAKSIRLPFIASAAETDFVRAIAIPSASLSLPCTAGAGAEARVDHHTVSEEIFAKATRLSRASWMTSRKMQSLVSLFEQPDAGITSDDVVTEAAAKKQCKLSPSSGPHPLLAPATSHPVRPVAPNQPLSVAVLRKVWEDFAIMNRAHGRHMRNWTSTTAGSTIDPSVCVGVETAVEASREPLHVASPEGKKHVVKPGCDMVVCAVRLYTTESGHKVHEIGLKCGHCDSQFVLTAAHECEKENDEAHGQEHLVEGYMPGDVPIDRSEPGLEWLRDETQDCIRIAL